MVLLTLLQVAMMLFWFPFVKSLPPPLSVPGTCRSVIIYPGMDKVYCGLPYSVVLDSLREQPEGGEPGLSGHGCVG